MMMIKFLTPQVWDGLVLGVALIGGALAILRLLNDWTAAQQRQRRAARPPFPSASLTDESEPKDRQPHA